MNAAAMSYERTCQGGGRDISGHGSGLGPHRHQEHGQNPRRCPPLPLVSMVLVFVPASNRYFRPEPALVSPAG